MFRFKPMLGFVLAAASLTVMHGRIVRLDSASVAD